MITELPNQDHVAELYDAIKSREVELVAEEILREDRIEFDYAVLSAIGLTRDEVRELHQFVAQSTANRITKARRQLTVRSRQQAEVE